MEQQNKKNTDHSAFLILTLFTFGAWIYVLNGKDSGGAIAGLAVIGTIIWVITGLAMYSAIRWMFGIVIGLIVLVKCWLPIALFLIWPPLFWIWLGAHMSDKD